MSDNQSNRTFSQEVALQSLPLLKWPALVLVCWLLFSLDSVKALMQIARDSNVKELGIGNAKMVLDTGEKVKTLQSANELNNLTSELKSSIAKLSEINGNANKEELKSLERKLDKVERKSSKVISQESPAFSQNKDNKHFININSSNKSTFNFEVNRDKFEAITIKVGMDDFPFKYSFNLCEKSGSYKNLKSVKSDKDGAVTSLDYTNEQVDCESSLVVDKLEDGSYIYAYSFNMLSGFNIAKVQGYDVFLPVTMHRSISNALYYDGMDPVVSSQYKNSKLVEETKVYID